MASRRSMSAALASLTQPEAATAESEKPHKAKKRRAAKDAEKPESSNDEGSSVASSQASSAKGMKLSKVRRLWREKEHVIPDASSFAHERALIKIATKGVVKLYNAVQKQQRINSGEIAVNDIPKGNFLQLLKSGGSVGTARGRNTQPSRSGTSTPASSSSAPKWGVLRDDFLTANSRKMKDWDKMEDEDNTNRQQNGGNNNSGDDDGSESD